MWQLTVFYICLSIGVAVFAATVITVIRFRQLKRRSFHRHLTIELIWTIIPFIMLIAMVIPALPITGNHHHNNVVKKQ